MPSRAVNVSGATFTGTQPLKSLPLNKGRNSSSARDRPAAISTSPSTTTGRARSRIRIRIMIGKLRNDEDGRGGAAPGWRRGPGIENGRFTLRRATIPCGTGAG